MGKKDIEKLDFILKKLINFGGHVSFNDLLNEGFYDEYKNDENKIKNDFDYLKTIFYDLKASSIVLNQDDYLICKTDDTIRFVNNYETFENYYLKLHSRKQKEEKKERQEKAKIDLQDKINCLTLENLEYQKLERKKDEQIKQLTSDNLRINNWDIRFRWIISISTFLAGSILTYLTNN